MNVNHSVGLAAVLTLGSSRMACRRRCLWAELRIPISSRSWSSTTLLPCRGKKRQRRLTFMQDFSTQSEQCNSVWVYNSGSTRRSLRFSSNLFASVDPRVVYKRTTPMRLMTYHRDFRARLHLKWDLFSWFQKGSSSLQRALSLKEMFL